MVQRGHSLNKIRNYLMGKGINQEFIKNTVNARLTGQEIIRE